MGSKIMPRLLLVCWLATAHGLQRPQVFRRRATHSAGVLRNPHAETALRAAADDRSETVKRLNDLFYAGGDDEADGGELADLPLWRVQWNALPGERQVYNVHVPHYTSMFERLVRRPRPWFFGHFYLPGGSENLRNPEYVLPDGKYAEKLGACMEVLAVARQGDGRLLVVSQCVGRLRVESVTQSVPHFRADCAWVLDGDVPGGEDEAARWRPFEYGVGGVRLSGGTAAVADLAPLDANLRPPKDADLDASSTALERRVWALVADNCAVLSRCLEADGASPERSAVQLPTNLLALAPPDLEAAARALVDERSVAAEASWPGHRRRQRLAFAVAAALGNLVDPALGRQELLAVETAQARLELVERKLEERLAQLSLILEAKEKGL